MVADRIEKGAGPALDTLGLALDDQAHFAEFARAALRQLDLTLGDEDGGEAGEEDEDETDDEEPQPGDEDASEDEGQGASEQRPEMDGEPVRRRRGPVEPGAWRRR